MKSKSGVYPKPSAPFVPAIPGRCAARFSVEDTSFLHLPPPTTLLPQGLGTLKDRRDTCFQGINVFSCHGPAPYGPTGPFAFAQAKGGSGLADLHGGQPWHIQYGLTPAHRAALLIFHPSASILADCFTATAMMARSMGSACYAVSSGWKKRQHCVWCSFIQSANRRARRMQSSVTMLMPSVPARVVSRL